MYELIIKGSRYESAEQDDYYCSETYSDLVTAIAAWDLARVGETPPGWATFHPGYYSGSWAILVGPGLLSEQQMPGDDAVERDDQWFEEQALEEGMLHGVDAYNDRKGC